MKKTTFLTILLDKAYHFDASNPALSEYYKEWMTHKRRHSYMVDSMAADIIASEPLLSLFGDEFVRNLHEVALLHDIARAREIAENRDSLIGNFKHHGIEGAMELAKRSFDIGYVIIPVMVHQFPNNNILSASLDEPINAKIFSEIGAPEQEFVIRMREYYAGLSKEEQHKVITASKLVRDADKIANLLEFDRMLALSPLKKSLEISLTIEDQLMNNPYVAYKDLNTYAEEAVAYLAWGKSLNFDSSRKVFNDYKIGEKIRDYTLARFPKASAEQKARAADVFNRGIAAIGGKDKPAELTISANSFAR